MNKIFALLVMALCACSAAPESPETSGFAETTYMNSDGETRPCDPIDAREREVANTPGSGWKSACRKFQRMGDVPIGDF